MRLRLALFGLVLALLGTAPPALADKRVALLIGNGEYRGLGPLATPRNDVALLKKALTEARFDEIRTAFDLELTDFDRALRAFGDAAGDADVALVYYSGRGMEAGGKNYLVPVDAKIASERDIDFETVPLDRVLDAIQGAKRLKLVILDACQRNPFDASMIAKDRSKAIPRGCAWVEPPDANTLVAFAGTPAVAALDGDNSPFAAALARRLFAPGVDVEVALREVHDDVVAATGARQEPFTSGSLGASPILPSKEAPSEAPVGATLPQ